MRMKRLSVVVLAASLGLAACSSSDDNTPTTPDPDLPVTGDFHAINPAEVGTYVANFEAQRGRISFAFDGVAHSLTFDGADLDDNSLLATYDDFTVIIGFDFENEEPLPTMTVFQYDDESSSITGQWSAQDLMLGNTAEDDIMYSGRLKDVASDAEFDVMLVLNESLLTGGTSTLVVSGTDALLNGEMGTATYTQMRDMIAANPNVTRLVIQKSSGSVNDDINVHTGRLIRAANLATHVPADGDINSGAVDLFTAGVTRTVEPGGILGVHSWCCQNGLSGDKLPRNDPAHGTQLTYFREMLPVTGVDFYFFTLQAAPFDGIHPMTREEMTRYNAVTNSN